VIVVRRGRKGKKDPQGFYEAKFKPNKGHAEGDFAIRVYDGHLDTPYRQELERRGAYVVPGGWAPFEADYLWDEERELFEAIKAKVAAER
jgi:hypothetical protein